VSVVKGEYPTILRRYFSSVIDGAILVVAYLMVAFALNSYGYVSAASASILLIVLFLYEPILVSRSCTLGQKITGIRVRSFVNRNDRIRFGIALVRSVVKFLLGIVSFFTISLSKNRRAIHDYLGNSIVVHEADAQ